MLKDSMLNKILYSFFIVGLFLILGSIDSYGQVGKKLKSLANIGGDRFSGAIKEPSGLFYDESKDRLYITDSGNNRLLSYDSEFLFLADFYNKNFAIPVSIVKASNGKFYFLDAKAGVLKVASPGEKDIDNQIYDFKITGIKKAKNPFVPGRIKIDKSDNLYVIDKLNGRIIKVSIDGKFLKSYSITSKTKGFFTFTDIALGNDGSLFAVDSIGRKVYIFSNDGKLKKSFGKYGHGTGQLLFPSSIALDSKNNIYVVDKHREQILVFARNGKFQYSLGSPGESPGKFKIPSHLIIDSQDRLYVIDAGRVQVLKEI